MRQTLHAPLAVFERGSVPVKEAFAVEQQCVPADLARGANHEQDVVLGSRVGGTGVSGLTHGTPPTERTTGRWSAWSAVGDPHTEHALRPSLVSLSAISSTVSSLQSILIVSLIGRMRQSSRNRVRKARIAGSDATSRRHVSSVSSVASGGTSSVVMFDPSAGTRGPGGVRLAETRPWLGYDVATSACIGGDRQGRLAHAAVSGWRRLLTQLDPAPGPYSWAAGRTVEPVYASGRARHAQQ